MIKSFKMSELICSCDESATNTEITAENAVVFNSKSSSSVMDYVRAISSIVGSSQIHSVFDNGEVCKVYLKDKKLVSTLIEAGVAFRGQLFSPDYNVPPGTKVSLLNVDPILPNFSLECVLSFYGTFESPIIRQKISSEEDFAHIECSTRIVYMKIFGGRSLPSTIPVYHGGKLHEVEIRIEKVGSPYEPQQSTSNVQILDD